MKKLLSIGIVLLALVSETFADLALKASKGAFINNVTNTEENANSHGVFPLKLSFNKISGASLYKIFSKDNEKADWVLIASLKEASLSKEALDDQQGVEKLFYIYKSDSAVPDAFATFKVEAYSSQDSSKPAEISEEDIGWGALTALTYMDTYNENVIKSHSKLTLMHKKVNLQKLGKDAALGEISGFLSYNAHVSGVNGVVDMEYSNYSEKIQWILNGNTNTKANIWANGKMYGTVKCIGMYPGSVVYDDIQIKKGKANGGFYTIKRKGFPDATLPWDSIQSEIKKIYKESED